MVNLKDGSFPENLPDKFKNVGRTITDQRELQELYELNSLIAQKGKVLIFRSDEELMSKYGLSVYKSTKNNTTYRKTINNNTLEVFINGNSVSIDIIDNKENRLCVANRYLCQNSEHLNFILTAGRANSFFILEEDKTKHIPRGYVQLIKPIVHNYSDNLLAVIHGNIRRHPIVIAAIIRAYKNLVLLYRKCYMEVSMYFGNSFQH